MNRPIGRDVAYAHPAAVAQPGIHAGGGADARARHRRQHRDLQPRGRHADAPVQASRTRRSSSCSSGRRRIPTTWTTRSARISSPASAGVSAGPDQRDGRRHAGAGRTRRFVSGNYFGVLGVPAAAGRVLGRARRRAERPAGRRRWTTRGGADGSRGDAGVDRHDDPRERTGRSRSSASRAKGFAAPACGRRRRCYLPLNSIARGQRRHDGAPRDHGEPRLRVAQRHRPAQGRRARRGRAPPPSTRSIRRTIRRTGPARQSRWS